jgi:Asp-tRNA(Asn)/Glu-tRNA(Gln) amidotransferase A subunit family amidase
MSSEAAFNLEQLHFRQASLLSSTLKEFLAERRNVGAVVYLQAMKTRFTLQGELERYVAKYDAIITPPTTGEAPATVEQTGNPCFCFIWSFCGVPVITIPVEFGSRGLPLGLQIVGPRGKDNQVLSMAQWCEGVFSFPPGGKITNLVDPVAFRNVIGAIVMAAASGKAMMTVMMRLKKAINANEALFLFR